VIEGNLLRFNEDKAIIQMRPKARHNAAFLSFSSPKNVEKV